jgi:hypothetical protein
MLDYQKDLQREKPNDEVYAPKYYKDTGYFFCSTAGYGYLVVPKNDQHANIAAKICKYGYVGDLAYYLEEDCELSEFLEKIEKAVV